MTPTTETHAEEDIRHTYGPKLVTSPGLWWKPMTA